MLRVTSLALLALVTRAAAQPGCGDTEANALETCSGALDPSCTASATSGLYWAKNPSSSAVSRVYCGFDLINGDEGGWMSLYAQPGGGVAVEASASAV